MAKQFSDMDRLKIEHAQAYVDHIDGLRAEKEAALEKIEFIRAMAMPGGVRYDAINVMTSPNDDAIPNAVAAIDDATDLSELVEQIDKEMEGFRLMLRFELKSIGAIYMYYHFFAGVPWNEIARTAGVDVTTERNRRKEALLEMYNKGLVPLEYRIPNYQAI